MNYVSNNDSILSEESTKSQKTTTVLSKDAGLDCPTFEDVALVCDLQPDIAENYQPATLGMDSDQERRILASILRDKDFGMFAAGVLTPASFTQKTHQSLASITFQFLKKYDDIPTREIVLGEIRQRHSDSKSLQHFLTESQVVLDYSDPTVCERQYYLDEIIRLGKKDLFRKAMSEGLDAIKQGRFDFEPIIDALQNAQSLDGDHTNRFEAMDAVEFFEMAKTVERSWIIDQWICEGSLHLFAGQKKIGKSTLLHSMIAALMTGTDWYGLACQQVPVVYLDFENPADYVRSNLLQMMPESGYHSVRQYLTVPTPESKPNGLTGEWLKGFLKHNGLLEYPSGIIFIDSARRAFNGLFPDVSNWENNASEVDRCMQPILKVARETNFAIVVIHHDNKSGDSSGSVDWEAISDFVWHYTASGGNRTLSSKHGRYVAGEPQSMVFRKPATKLEFVGSGDDIRAEHSQREKKSKLDAVTANLVPHIPELPLGANPTEDSTVTVQDLIASTGKSRDVLQKELRILRDSTVVQSQKFAQGRNKPLHYWRLNQAMA